MKEKMTLQEWIEETGAGSVAKLLKINESTVRHWRVGRCLPRTGQMFLIQRYSKGRVSYHDMIEGFHKAQSKKKIGA